MKRKPDDNSENNLGLQERNVLLMLTGPQKRLDYPTQPLEMSNGCVVEQYVIPEAERAKVLEMLYPFTDMPGMDDEMLDLHTEKCFIVRDYIAVREGDGNFLVTPYYAEAGGTVLDWISPNDAYWSGENLKVLTVRNKQVY